MSDDATPAIGCVKCGFACSAPDAVYAECPTCGKTVGVCLECVRARAIRWANGAAGVKEFLDESMQWHIERRHPETLPPAELADTRDELLRYPFGNPHWATQGKGLQ